MPSSDPDSGRSAGYVSLTAELSESAVEEAEMLFYESGALGLEVQDSELLPMPGTAPLPTGLVRVTAFFTGSGDAGAANRRLREAVPLAKVTLVPVPPQDWSSAWKSHVKSVRLGRLWIGPPWEKAPPDRIPIWIEPQMAFGTGDHPTTVLCLEAIEQYLGRHPGSRVLDVGTGSGILAIAARKLGAGRVVALDNDPVATAVATQNASLNRADNIEISSDPLEDVIGTFHFVVANILANTLVEMAPALARRSEDEVVLAGILVGQQDQVTEEQCRQGLILERFLIRGEWIRLDFRRP